jgi:hypothetical protein
VETRHHFLGLLGNFLSKGLPPLYILSEICIVFWTVYDDIFKIIILILFYLTGYTGIEPLTVCVAYVNITL